jgi:hypothetical protein
MQHSDGYGPQDDERAAEPSGEPPAADAEAADAFSERMRHELDVANDSHPCP